MSVFMVFAIVALIFLAGISIFNLLNLLGFTRMYQAALTGSPPTIKGTSRQIPKEGQQLRRTLADLDFTLAAESVPVNAEGEQGRPTWYFLHPDGQTVALLTLLERPGAVVKFQTLYEDGAMLETHYPGGLPVDFPDYQATVNPDSADAALTHHQAAQPAFSAAHGDPLTLDSPDALNTWQQAHFHAHVERRLYPLLRRYRLFTAASFALVLAWLIAALILDALIFSDF